jgi:hypothetical protein
MAADGPILELQTVSENGPGFDEFPRIFSS